MKVAHLVTSFSADPGSGDGPGDELVDLAAVAGPTGVEPVVVVLGSSGDRWDVNRLRRLKVPVVEMGLAPWDPRAVGRTARLLREHGVDLVHTHRRPADVVGALATRLPGSVPVPMVSTLYTSRTCPPTRRTGSPHRQDPPPPPHRGPYDRDLAPAAGALPALSGTDRGLVVVPNGIADPGPLSADDRARVRRANGSARAG